MTVCKYLLVSFIGLSSCPKKVSKLHTHRSERYMFKYKT